MCNKARDMVNSVLLTGGQSALDRLSVVGMSALKPSSSSSYMKAVLLGKNCSLTLIFGGLKMASNTPLPMLVWNFVSCIVQPADYHGKRLEMTGRTPMLRRGVEKSSVGKRGCRVGLPLSEVL